MTVNETTLAQIKTLSDAFADSHFLKIPDMFESDRIGVYWLQLVHDDLRSRLVPKTDSLNISEPTWAIINTMLDRVYEYCEGSFVNYISGTWASTEVAVRTVMEAAVNVMYITSQDKEKRLVQYLTHFWINEKELSQKRLKMVSRLQGKTAIAQKESVEFNIEFNKSREILVNTILKNDRFSSVNEPGWPAKIIDRFVDLGMETEYRTIYSFLSSEVHNDASALVDFMIFKALENFTPERAGLEVYLRVRLYLYMGLGYFIRAAHYYADSFSLDMTDEIAQAYQSVDEIKNSISLEIINLRNSV